MSALGDDQPWLPEPREVHSGVSLVPAVLGPSTPPGAAAEGGPTTLLNSVELPRWIDDPRVDSRAMLSAFLEYRGRCTGEASAQLGDLYMIVHRLEPEIVLGGQVIRPQEIRSQDIPTRPCADQVCERCRTGRGGYQFKWYHVRWGDVYCRLCRLGAWTPC